MFPETFAKFEYSTLVKVCIDNGHLVSKRNFHLTFNLEIQTVHITLNQHCLTLISLLSEKLYWLRCHSNSFAENCNILQLTYLTVISLENVFLQEQTQFWEGFAL